MSQEGLDKLKKELADALAQRPVISAAIAEAREKGDLSENAEYESAREAQGLLEMKIANLQNQVANAKVVDASQLSTDKVQMLNKVKVQNLSAGMTMEFTIVGETDTTLSRPPRMKGSMLLPSGVKRTVRPSSSSCPASSRIMVLGITRLSMDSFITKLCGCLVRQAFKMVAGDNGNHGFQRLVPVVCQFTEWTER